MFSRGSLFSRSVNVNEALRIQMEVQRRLHGELEVHAFTYTVASIFALGSLLAHRSFGFFLLALHVVAHELCVNASIMNVLGKFPYTCHILYGDFCIVVRMFRNQNRRRFCKNNLGKFT
jgi:hypothetical protein